MNAWLRVAVFITGFVIVAYAVGGVWGVILGFFASFSATVFLNSHFAERSSRSQSLPSAEQSHSPQTHRANAALNQARIILVLLVAWLLLPVFAQALFADRVSLWLAGHLIIFAFVHVALGRAAVLAGRSWVSYGLSPVLLPILGALVSFAVLRSKVPYADA